MSTSSTQGTVSRPQSFNDINHLKLPSIKRTIDFYTKVLLFEHMPKYDHFTFEHQIFARMVQHNDLIVELRYVPDFADAQRAGIR